MKNFHVTSDSDTIVPFHIELFHSELVKLKLLIMQTYFKLPESYYFGENSLPSRETITVLVSSYTKLNVFLHSNQQGCSYPPQLRRINHPSFRHEQRGGGVLLYVQRKDLNLNNYVNEGGAFRHVSGNCLKVLKGNNIGKGCTKGE